MTSETNCESSTTPVLLTITKKNNEVHFFHKHQFFFLLKPHLYITNFFKQFFSNNIYILWEQFERALKKIICIKMCALKKISVY